MSVVVVAEKPSVARDLARVLGATRSGDGFLEGNGYRVTWAIGHLVGLAEPHEVNADWKRWDFRLLPMVPEQWPLKVLPKTRAQFAVVRQALRDPATERVICATDAGREGELIFRLIYEAAGCRKPVQRLWVSSLTDDALRAGLRRLKDAREYDALGDAARARSQADWLVGMNLSRAYGLSLGQTGMSVGRVQTPTLALVAQREVEIRDFKPEDYLEVVATFEGRTAARYRGTWFKAPKDDRRLPADGKEADAIVARAKRGQARIETVKAETKRMPPPLLYDLTELQRHANRLYGMSAHRTLATAQTLYERHKLLSYPRTDSRHLSADVARTLPAVVAAVSERYGGALAPGTLARPLGRRFVDDAKVSDHHAIVPTEKRANVSALGEDERRIYDLVCRRLLSAWHDDHVWDVTTVVTAIHTAGPPEMIDRYRSQGTAVRAQGWKVLDVAVARRRDDGGEDDAQALPAGLAAGQAQRVVDARAVKKTTRPPPRYTEATLLTAMEVAGAQLDDKELSEAMKARGLGTPATRAATIETLLDRDYIVRAGKALQATDKGLGLIAAVDATVKSPAMTGDWEARLRRIERGDEHLPAFMAAIEGYVREVVARVPPPAPGAPRAAGGWRGKQAGGGSTRGRGSRTGGRGATRPGDGGRAPRKRAASSAERARPPKRQNDEVERAPRRRAATGTGGASLPELPLDDGALEQRILVALRTRDGQSTGRLCKALLGEDPALRRRFEAVLGKLSAAGTLRVAPDVFEVDGRKIPFKRAFLSRPATAL